MNMLFKHFFAAFILFSIFSCKKSTVPNVVYPDIYTAKSLTQKSNIRLFTNGQEVLDQSVINKYIGKDINNFNPVFDPSRSDTMKFTAPDTMNFGNPLYKYKVVKNGELYLLYAPATFPVSNFFLSLNFLSYTSPVVQIPGGANGTMSGRQDVRVAYGNYKNLALSVLIYKATSPQYYLVGTLNNDFNENATVGLNDTLAIKEYSLNYVSITQ